MFSGLGAPMRFLSAVRRGAILVIHHPGSCGHYADPAGQGWADMRDTGWYKAAFPATRPWPGVPRGATGREAMSRPLHPRVRIGARPTARTVRTARVQFVLDSAENELLRWSAGPWLSPVFSSCGSGTDWTVAFGRVAWRQSGRSSVRYGAAGARPW